MLAKRIIPCLDVLDGKVVKGVQFKNHEVVGDILELAQRYQDEGADELVFYDISASGENRVVDKTWVKNIAKKLNIPFCVAGGIRTIDDAKTILNYGADKFSINSPALENPDMIEKAADVFGSQCVVVGIDSRFQNGDYHVYQYTGSSQTIREAERKTLDWAIEAASRGAGEIVLNCMNQDGMRKGYDITQLELVAKNVTIPVVASGGAGAKEHFKEVFQKTEISAALAASVFHKDIIKIADLKNYLKSEQIPVRI